MVSSFLWSNVSDKAREKRRTGKKREKEWKKQKEEEMKWTKREREKGDVIGALGKRDTCLPFS